MMGAYLLWIENHGRYVVTGCLRANLPSSCSCSSAVAVNDFEMDPISKSVSGVIGARVFISANP